MSAEFEHLREQVSALLREGMDATGTSTLHYQKMAEAIELMGGAHAAARPMLSKENMK